MQFKQGTLVFTQDGKEAGHIDRVVIHPKSKLVTHIVIRKGLLFTEDKVVPVKMIGTGRADRITLQMNSNKLNDLPNYEETHYILLNEEEMHDAPQPANIVPAVYWYPPYPEPSLAPYVEPPYVAETRVNIPKGTIAVKEGAKVVTRDDKHIGNVEQVLTSANSDRVTHFIVSKGLVLKEKKMVPFEWIDTLSEDEVRLAVKSRIVEELPSLEHA